VSEDREIRDVMCHRADEDGDSGPVARSNRSESMVVDLFCPLRGRIILEATIPAVVNVMRFGVMIASGVMEN